MTLAKICGRIKNSKGFIVSFPLFFLTVCLYAEMYIWKDAQGNQHVTDSPPPKDSSLLKSFGSENLDSSSVESFVPGRSPQAEVLESYRNLTRLTPYKIISKNYGKKNGIETLTAMSTVEVESQNRYRTLETRGAAHSESGYYDGYFFRQKRNGQFIKARESGKGASLLSQLNPKKFGVRSVDKVKFIGKETLGGHKCAVYVVEGTSRIYGRSAKLWVRLDKAIPLQEQEESLGGNTTINYEYPRSINIPNPSFATEVSVSDYLILYYE